MKGFFYGWYLKCQSGAQTLAVIPAFHKAGKKCTCSVQIITDKNSWTISFPADKFHHAGDHISIDRNLFCRRGIRLEIHTPEVDVKGRLRFGPLSPLKYDIMGPFVLVPHLECRHSVFSMTHSVCGTVYVNEEKYVFKDAWGYWEGDRGRSFPKDYVWTQCCFSGGSLMLSVADIPIAGFHFNGVICVVLWQGREYRLATYLGARAVQIRDGRIRIIQGNLELEAKLLKKAVNPLQAPAMGDMVRTIHESAASRAYYRFRKGKNTLFAFETDRASFEYEYPH
ncbi:MAG: hypothetical protein J1E83_03070 [Lachnospiraceae bacterium]|nr:hypothetical protein [Lachnospiraceae bacterium]